MNTLKTDVEIFHGAYSHLWQQIYLWPLLQRFRHSVSAKVSFVLCIESDVFADAEYDDA